MRLHRLQSKNLCKALIYKGLFVNVIVNVAKLFRLQTLSFTKNMVFKHKQMFFFRQN